MKYNPQEELAKKNQTVSGLSSQMKPLVENKLISSQKDLFMYSVASHNRDQKGVITEKKQDNAADNLKNAHDELEDIYKELAKV